MIATRSGVKVHGYTVGVYYHDSYFCYDFLVLGSTAAGEVAVRHLDGMREVRHRTSKSRFTVPIGTCPVNGCASGPANRQVACRVSSGDDPEYNNRG